MKLVARTLVCVTVLGCQVLCARAQEQQLPDVAHSLGMLAAFIHTAEAYRTLCRPHVRPADHERYIESWFVRNQNLADKIFDAGAKVKWGLPPGNHVEAWQRIREQDSKRLRAQVAEAIAPAPGAMCLDGMRPFRDKNYELSYFPFHLKALGVSAQ
jgi:hypothetical protein